VAVQVVTTLVQVETTPVAQAGTTPAVQVGMIPAVQVGMTPVAQVGMIPAAQAEMGMALVCTAPQMQTDRKLAKQKRMTAYLR